MTQLVLEYTKGEHIDVTSVANIDGTAGRVKLNLDRVEGLRHGAFRLRVQLSGSKSKSIVTQELVTVTTNINVQTFSYELHQQDGASDDLRAGELKQWTYPEAVTDLSKEQGTDYKKIFFTAKVSLQDSKKQAVGQPEQVYLAFKRTDGDSADQQLQVNNLAMYNDTLGIYAGKVNFTDKFDQVNGEYEVKLVALDSSAGKQEWKLGSISIWFREGEYSANN